MAFLLLGTSDSRRFTPAELRLLLALGHQIGMAVENSYLIQQTSRRSEELHVLNEIGRALSSTLNKEDLLRKVWEELRRLFDVENFYIASLESNSDEMTFDLEMIDGARMPRRTRPSGNHITEYIIRTRQPVLIRENYVEEVKKLGVDPIRTRGCFCGVPLVAYDRAIGAMAVFSDNERTFDEGHLELLRVLASEASIAIENARLFHEERTKARHLSLLNIISRNAIATLNPDEMLAKIAEQLEDGLTYDHIGIGVLDYSTREIVVQAEAGKRRGSLRSTHTAGRGPHRTCCPQWRDGFLSWRECRRCRASSPCCLTPPRPWPCRSFMPSTFTEYFSSNPQPTLEFSEEEVLLIRTLADLIAGALHNADSFQKAQEQAITDGLTGVKTHRFFMEALVGRVEALHPRRSRLRSRADGPRPLQIRQRFLRSLEGDLVLQRVGHILETNCRRSDVVARYGGDEFVILMPETNMEHARQLSSKLRSWVSADPLAARKKYQRQLRHRLLSVAWLLPAGTYPGGGRLHVSLQASGWQYRLHRRSLRSQRSQKMEARRSGSLSRRHAEASFLHRPRSFRGNLFAPETIYGIAGSHGNRHRYSPPLPSKVRRPCRKRCSTP